MVNLISQDFNILQNIIGRTTRQIILIFKRLEGPTQRESYPLDMPHLSMQRLSAQNSKGIQLRSSNKGSNKVSELGIFLLCSTRSNLALVSSACRENGELEISVIMGS